MFDPSGDRSILLSATRAPAAQRRLAVMVSVLLLVMLVATAPFARVTWIALPVIVPIGKTLMLVADLITAVLLFEQYSIEPTRGLKLVATGYLFTALVTIPHTLAFPGVFSEAGLLGTGGTQSAAWLYIAWHGGLPIATIAFALTRNAQTVDIESIDKVGASIRAAVFSAIIAVLAVTLLATAGRRWLPVLVEDGRFTTASRFVVGALLVLPVCGLSMLLRGRSLMDLWLMVVMFAWFCTTTVGAFLSGGRFDVGWYMSALFDALTSIFVLLVLLHQILVLYARQFRAAVVERCERERRLNEMEAILVHLSRVEEIGRNASTLIHEIGQPLAAISMLTQVSLKQCEATRGRLKQSLDSLAGVAADAFTMLERLRGFIKINPLERRVELVPEIIEGAIKLASLGGAYDLIIDTQYHPAATLAFCDRIQIQQVVFNLARNAIEAMAGSSRLALRIRTELDSEGWIQISIADTGPGLPSVVRRKLFEPFVTTKPSGLGVGLSICRIIIQAHGGKLLADDNPGGGTVFVFTLPQRPVDAFADEAWRHAG